MYQRLPLLRSFILLTSALSLGLFSLLAGKVSDKPNIILIMVDDMGYSDLGCYGGEIPTPTLDKLAGNGIRFSQFYNTGRCCPTRASLLTGLYQHQTGIGQMTSSRDFWADSYQGYLNQNCVTLAEVLRTAGYQTYMTGKWHVGLKEKFMWPKQRGFDRYYGILEGSSNFFRPQESKKLMLDNEPQGPQSGDYYTTDAFTEYAMQFISEGDPEKPFFLYLAYTAPHWPLHVPKEEFDKFRGKYLKGWDKLREERWQRQLEMGIVKEKWELSPRDPDVPAWDTLSDEDKDDLDFRMACYAGMIHRVDTNIGKLVAQLEEAGQLDNTLILFLSDNGGCPEPWNDRVPNGRAHLGGHPVAGINHWDYDKMGAFTYGQGWANASNTPFREFKTQSHEGGVATPLIAHFPQGIAMEPGKIVEAPAHIIDIMATVVDLSGADYPEVYKGNWIHQYQGKSLVPIFQTGTRRPHEWLFWEHVHEGAVRTGDWKAVFRQVDDEWYLYNLAEDRNEIHDLSTELPQILKPLQDKWWEWAVVNGVEPMTYSLLKKGKSTEPSPNPHKN